MKRKVMVVVADDLGKDRWSLHPLTRLKALEAAGRRFSRAWMGPLCSNARACLHTGAESHRPVNLVGSNFPSPNPSFRLDVTHGGLLAQQAPGASACIGKWHLCNLGDYDHPNQAGFDEFRGSLGNLSNYEAWERVANGIPSPWTFYAPEQAAADAWGMLDLGVDLVVVNFWLPHFPLHEPPPHLHSGGPPWTDEALFAAMVEALDNLAAPLIQHAAALGYVVLFIGDNGTAPQMGGKKGTLFEGGICVPAWACGEGVAPGDSGLLVQSTDWHATILELMGSGTPGQDSLSVAEDILGSRAIPRTYSRCSKWFPTGEAPTLPSWDRAARSRHWKLISNSGGTSERLHDLRVDPDEQDNLLLGDLSEEASVALARLRSALPT